MLAGCGGPTVDPTSAQPEGGGKAGASSQTAVAPPQQVTKGQMQFVAGFATGSEYAKQVDRPMLLFFTAQWCTYCHQMEQDAFVNPEVASLAKRFVCVLVDADKEPEVCREFGVRGYPTIQFLTSRGIPLNRLVGKRPADYLVSQMQAALEAAEARALQGNGSFLR